MSRVRKTDVVAVLCSDIHLSHKPPSARSAEPNWYEAMERQIDQLVTIADRYQAPIICAGDVFDKWNSPPELINWAARKLPKMWTVPGQHDLPWHGYDQIRKSAYWTLVELGVLNDIAPGIPEHVDDLILYGYPWGFDPVPIVPCKDKLSMAVIHQYCWVGSHGYEDAPEKNSLAAWEPLLSGYNVAVVGDNHSGFLTRSKGCVVCNCGGFMRRRANERAYQPAVGLLAVDGTVTRKPLDGTEDVFTESSVRAEQQYDDEKLKEFVEDVLGLEADKIDFLDALQRAAFDGTISEGAKSVLLEVIEDVRAK